MHQSSQLAMPVCLPTLSLNSERWRCQLAPLTIILACGRQASNEQHPLRARRRRHPYRDARNAHASVVLEAFTVSLAYKIADTHPLDAPHLHCAVH
jgi:hypothetical protein